MEEKRKDLRSTRQKEIIDKVIAQLHKLHPSFYYLSTIEVAAEIKKYTHEPNNLSLEELELVDNLSRRDIQILLSMH